MDDLLSFSRGTSRSYSLYKRYCTQGKIIARGKTQLNFQPNLDQLLSCDWFKYICEGGDFLAW